MIAVLLSKFYWQPLQHAEQRRFLVGRHYEEGKDQNFQNDGAFVFCESFRLYGSNFVTRKASCHAVLLPSTLSWLDKFSEAKIILKYPNCDFGAPNKFTNNFFMWSWRKSRKAQTVSGSVSSWPSSQQYMSCLGNKKLHHYTPKKTWLKGAKRQRHRTWKEVYSPCLLRPLSS